ncbi:hypothetical protein PACTADRAFT_49312 [Pachysolen tannophilus NRRL Y-2460]|uniref:MAT1 centre domain-containing protein n=1 Tax=Pachysolen tannophilus NRRL Y-2460 TaxID=669874 RepID=A0A1E4TVV8_PACTA|nr:hypothetical protein PACTADRAFT_49312 [Pachysolen tannophilus NRRL Y-2460]
MGPTKCPYPNCNKILRKNKFKKQIFDDLNIEKECDIRKKILEIYNKQESNFKNLNEYNKYLEEIETIIFNLSHDIDIEETTNLVKQYELMNKELINENNDKISKDYENFMKRQNLEKSFKQTRLKLQKEIEDEDAKLKKLKNLENLNNMYDEGITKNKNNNNNNNNKNVLNQMKESILKKTSARQKQLKELEQRQQERLSQLTSSFGGQQLDDINGKLQKPETPFTPFNGDRVLKLPYNEDNDYYDPIYFNLVEKNDEFRASGYNLKEFFKRSLSEAFIGLDCFICDEK